MARRARASSRGAPARPRLSPLPWHVGMGPLLTGGCAWRDNGRRGAPRARGMTHPAAGRHGRAGRGRASSDQRQRRQRRQRGATARHSSSWSASGELRREGAAWGPAPARESRRTARGKKKKSARRTPRRRAARGAAETVRAQRTLGLRPAPALRPEHTDRPQTAPQSRPGRACEVGYTCALS